MMKNANDDPRSDRKMVALVNPAVFFMFLIIFLTFLQVCLRYVFSHSLAWIEEVSRYLFVWIVFLGAAISFKDGTHIRIDFIDKYLAGRSKTLFGYLIGSINLFGVVLVLYSGLLVAWRNRGSMFYTLPDIPLLLMYIAIPLCCTFMAAIIILKFIRGTKTLNE